VRFDAENGPQGAFCIFPWYLGHKNSGRYTDNVQSICQVGIRYLQQIGKKVKLKSNPEIQASPLISHLFHIAYSKELHGVHTNLKSDYTYFNQNTNNIIFSRHNSKSKAY
jgi:hypothetical protein